MKFINREGELKALEERWQSGKPELFIVYGKRRVGKTELIKQFINGKRAIYFLADKRTMDGQLWELARLVGEAFADPLISRQGFGDWLDVFAYLKRNITERITVVVDEYPYLAKVDRATSSLFQKGWDEYLAKSNIVLVLMGSSIAMMESEALAARTPLFGRRTGQLLLQPLTFLQSRQFFPNASFLEMLETFTVTGGMPAYLAQIQPRLSLKENIIRGILPTTEFLHNEVEFVLKEELREPKNYLAILRAIAFGKRKLGEIVNDTGIEKSTVNKYLSSLMQLKIVQRETPITERQSMKSRKGLYRLCDNFFRFWFQYVFPYHSDLEIDRTTEVLRKFKEQFHALVEVVYEEVCIELLMQWEDRLFRFEKIGRWWDANNEIDIVATNAEANSIVFAECKWSQKQVGVDIFESLKEKSRSVIWGKPNRKEFYMLFGKSGFTPHMVEMAQREGVLLVQEDRVIY